MRSIDSKVAEDMDRGEHRVLTVDALRRAIVEL